MQWCHHLPSDLWVYDAWRMQVCLKLYQLLDGLDIPRNECLSDGRDAQLIGFVDLCVFTVQDIVNTLHLFRLDGKVQESLPIVIKDVWIAMLFKYQSLHALFKHPSLRIAKVGHFIHTHVRQFFPVR